MTLTVTAPSTSPPGLLPRLLVGGSLNGSGVQFESASGGPFSAARSLAPFGQVPANVRTAMGDVDGDGTPDSILVTGPGTPIRFAVISGSDNSTVLIPPTPPFAGSENFVGGGFVSAADFDGDKRAEIIITPDLGGGPRVSIFSFTSATATVIANFFGIDDPTFRGGARTGG